MSRAYLVSQEHQRFLVSLDCPSLQLLLVDQTLAHQVDLSLLEGQSGQGLPMVHVLP